jgi:hypothetical protein
MTGPRYIYTCSTGRCGQNTISDILKAHVPSAFVAFEEPHVNVQLPGPLGVLERRFRRAFVETHELLGRGKVLAAFDAGDEAQLERFGRARFQWMEEQMKTFGKTVFFDVSKHFCHGQHLYLTRLNSDWGLMQLTRDPVVNMRSYLNRRKNFFLDNNRPDSRNNILRLPTAELSPGELYLWAWFETELRFADLRDRFKPRWVFSLRTEHLNDAATLEKMLAAFGLEHLPLKLGVKSNTNVGLGYGETRVSREDVATFEKFLSRVPKDLVGRISYLDGYVVRKVHAASLGA